MVTTAASAGGLRSRVRQLEEIPPLPHDTQRLLELLSDDEVDLEEVAGGIEKMPPLAARIVGLSSSAYFGSGASVRSVADAIIRVLGLRLVRNLALGIVLSGTFKPSRCRQFSADRYWGSALLTAGMSRSLAARACGETVIDAEGGYLCGLLHNLGLLALVHVSPLEMARVLEAAAADPDRSLRELECELLGVHHGTAGAWLAYRWQLPAEVGAAIEHHHETGYRGEHWAFAQLVGLAARWGRQRLAGVAEPSVPPERLEALGVSEAAFAGCTAECERYLDEIDELTGLLAGPG